MRLIRVRLTALLTALLTVLLLAAGTLTGVASAQPARNQLASDTGLAGVPWRHVGPGWVLAQYTTAVPDGGKTGPAALYLVSPGGAKYKLASWPDNRTAPQLLAWSPDGKHALFQVSSGKGGVENMTLATGKTTTFALPGGASPIGYTTPGGLNIAAGRLSGSQTILARYNLSGKLTRSLGWSADGAALYEPSGAAFVTGTSAGLKLVSNNGTLVRKLPVPGTSANTCNPARWWNATTVLAYCAPPGSAAPQLWLVPLGGGRPAALTPRRSASSRDLGDLDAWPLSSGLYLQAAGPCGVLQIFKQARNGSIKLVTVPHTEGDNVVLTATGSRMLIEAPTSCVGSNSLLWYNPGTHAEQWLIRAPSNVIGVENAVPFYSRQNGNM
jgi:TolB protein